MLCDVVWSEDGTYAPQGAHKPIEFFNNALKNSTTFDLELGYFNSATISVLSLSFASFISNGGKMRMAINQIVSPKDKQAITEGEQGIINEPFDLTNWQSLYQNLNEYDRHFFNCLAYLIHEKRIEIKIVKPKNSVGIAHTKKGLFFDGDMSVLFTGSANFTLGGLFNNREEISLSFSSSPDPVVQKRISNQQESFDRLMNGTDDSVEYLSTDDLVEAVRSQFNHVDIEELLDVETKLRAHKPPKGLGYSFDSMMTVEDESEVYVREPRFPYPTGPREYQKEAFEKWKNNNQKGLFAMATGTGKTITALNCLLEIYNRKQYYKAIILVPTIVLVDQWEEECRKFSFDNIIKVFSKNASWKSQIDSIVLGETLKPSEQDPGPSFVIISTFASFSKLKVFNKLNSFDPRRVLLIADECHNMGSPALLKLLKKIVYGRRIGLSATPNRQYDDEGNEKIRSFFGASEGYTFEYSMEDAIKNDVLCHYLYFPHVVELNQEEMEQYTELSLKIAKYYNYNTGEFGRRDDILTSLLLARKRIIHKAANKYNLFKQIIEERYEEKKNLAYTLVYVPEGNKPDYLPDTGLYDETGDEELDKDSNHLIDIYTKAVMNLNERITVKKFMSGQKDRDVLLNKFASGDIQVLMSMKCLDEGVDVPRSELAIFCASTGNPRQFIQRRGRILRKHKDKTIAVIHDMVVAPKIGVSEASYKMEQSLLLGELTRVMDFANMSDNPVYSELALRDVLDYYGLNLTNNDFINKNKYND